MFITKKLITYVYYKKINYVCLLKKIEGIILCQQYLNIIITMSLFGLYYNITSLHAYSEDIDTLFRMIDALDPGEKDNYRVHEVQLFRAIPFYNLTVSNIVNDEGPSAYSITVTSGKRVYISRSDINNYVQRALCEICDDNSTNKTFEYDLNRTDKIIITFDLKNSVITKKDGLYEIRHYYNIINNKNGRYDRILNFKKIINHNGFYVMKNKEGIDSILVFCAFGKVSREEIEEMHRPNMKLDSISSIPMDKDMYYPDGCFV